MRTKMNNIDVFDFCMGTNIGSFTATATAVILYINNYISAGWTMTSIIIIYLSQLIVLLHQQNKCKEDALDMEGEE